MVGFPEKAVARDDVTVKMDAQTVRKAKMVAAGRGITLAEYLTQIVRPVVDRDLEEETKRVLSGLGPEPKKPRKGAAKTSGGKGEP
jgi:hypothetical protein